MPVLMRATVAGNAKQRLSLAAKGIAPERITSSVTRGMVQSFFPDLFRGNAYQWQRPLRGGMPLWDTGTHILSAFSYGASGALGWIRNGFKYAHVHDKGMTIKAKNAKYLRFKIRGGGWAQKKEVTIPRRRFLFWSASAIRFARGRVENLVRSATKRHA